MSAFVVSKEHIDYLVRAAQMNGYQSYQVPIYGYRTDAPLNPRTCANEIGRALWEENVKSVAYRYPNDKPGEWPGPIGLDWETVAQYRYQPALWPANPVVALKAIGSYEYQSCEHPGWETSEAKKFCDSLRDSMIGILPGYDDAPWEIGPDTDLRAIA